MSDVTIEVPAETVDQFDQQISRTAAGYADRAKSAAEFWEKHPAGVGDLDSSLALLSRLREIVVTRNADGSSIYTGSPWVLSDVADALLVTMIDQAREVAFTSPVEYAEVVTHADRIAAWSKRCGEIDATYRAAPTEA